MKKMIRVVDSTGLGEIVMRRITAGCLVVDDGVDRVGETWGTGGRDGGKDRLHRPSNPKV